MIARRGRRAGAYDVTPRKVAAYGRRARADREKLPLFASDIAATQRSAEAEMERRTRQWADQKRERRLRLAEGWKRVRARYYALPPAVRGTVRQAWARFGGPKESAYLSAVLWSATEGLQPMPSDFAALPASQRVELTARLNDRARRDDPWTRTHRIFSPGVRLWLNPGFEASAEKPWPAPYEGVAGLGTALWHAIATYDGFGHNSDLSGERRQGVVEVMAREFRFVIAYRRPGVREGALGVCPVPWNADLSVRRLWIGLAEEAAPEGFQ